MHAKKFIAACWWFGFLYLGRKDLKTDSWEAEIHMCLGLKR